jgi:hypothetical protein
MHYMYIYNTIYIHSTIYIHNIIYIHNTIYINNTIYIHNAIYLNNTINDDMIIKIRAILVLNIHTGSRKLLISAFVRQDI